MTKVLITAYAVNPYKGSEDGTGWNMVRELAMQNEVTLITRKNNIPHLQQYFDAQKETENLRLKFVGFDLPNWVLWLKKRSGERGYVLYYYFWQMLLPLFIKRLGLTFDIAHSLNFHSDSVPQFLWVLGKPTVWGPIGHHPKVPIQFFKGASKRKNLFKDRLYFTVKWALRNLDPFFYLAVAQSNYILGINKTIGETIGAPAHKIAVLPAVAAPSPVGKKTLDNDIFRVLMVGRFHYMKGFDVAIASFANFLSSLEPKARTNVRLTLVGKGVEKENLSLLAKTLGVEKEVEWISWVDRDAMEAIYSASDVFLFPSHEGAGMVVPEAMSYGLPVIAFDNSGPGELVGDAGLKVPYGSYEKSCEGFADLLGELYRSPGTYKHYSAAAKARFNAHFTWGSKRDSIQAVYSQILQPNPSFNTQLS